MTLFSLMTTEGLVVVNPMYVKGIEDTSNYPFPRVWHDMAPRGFYEVEHRTVSELMKIVCDAMQYDPVNIEIALDGETISRYVG